MALRDFQTRVRDEVYRAWAEPNVHNVMPVMATGGGKTVLFSRIITEYQRPACVIAHRQELVSQASLALNRERVPHGIIAQKKIQQQIAMLHHAEHGYSMYDSRAAVRVAGVDTLKNHDTKDRWPAQVDLVVQDEGHHVLRDNKWGAAMAMFPNARGLFPTAHAIRADGQGLGRTADGLVDALVVGPSCRELIGRGFLTDYMLLCPSSDIDFSHLEVGATGDYSLPKLRAVTHQSNRIVGDVVRHYLKYAAGKLGVTFAVDVEAAKDIARAYNAANVPAEVISAKTPVSIRGQLMRQFRARRLLQLVSVDCLGEGVDVPAIEVISMARKTASFQLFSQQMGRSLRVMLSDEEAASWGEHTDEERLRRIAAGPKPIAIVIDHVGNFIYHAERYGLVCMPKEYSLDRRESRSRGIGDGIPMRACAACTKPYERYLAKCPYCGYAPEPAGRSSPELVEGDLVLLDATALRSLRGAIQRIDGPAYMPKDAGEAARKHILRTHHDRSRAQQSLRHAMTLWGGWQNHLNRSEREAHKLFFLTFGIDVMTAQTLGSADAAGLEVKIRAQLAKYNVIEAQPAEAAA